MNLVRYIRFTGILLLILILSPSVRGESIDDNRINKKYGIVFSGSWNYLRNEKLNDDYIETWSSWGFLDDKINSGFGLSSEIIYYLSPKISIGAGVIYISGSTKKDHMVIDYSIDDTTVAHDYVKTGLYAPSFSLRYFIQKDEIGFSLGISESFLFGKASRHHTSDSFLGGIYTIKNNYYSKGIGFQLFCGINTD